MMTNYRDATARLAPELCIVCTVTGGRRMPPHADGDKCPEEVDRCSKCQEKEKYHYSKKCNNEWAALPRSAGDFPLHRRRPQARPPARAVRGEVGVYAALQTGCYAQMLATHVDGPSEAASTLPCLLAERALCGLCARAADRGYRLGAGVPVPPEAAAAAWWSPPAADPAPMMVRAHARARGEGRAGSW